MVRVNEISEAMLHVVGWDKEFGFEGLSESLTKSESGLYFQQMHSLLGLENVEAIAPQFDEDIYEFDKETPYEVGGYVTYKGSIYRALKGSKGVSPDDKATWTIAKPFSEWLEKKTKSSIVKVINRLVEEKVSDGSMKTLCERKILFNNTGRICDTEPNQRKMVGFEITPVRALGVTTKIERIGLQFTKPGDYKLYLMQSGVSTPYKIISLKKVQANSMEWFDIDDCFLPYFDKHIDAGGSWYLCYAQSELPEGSQAIRKDYDWAQGPCESCSRGQYILWKAWSKYLQIHPFSVDEDQICGTGFSDDFNQDFARPNVQLWDVENNVYRYDTNYGLNLEVTVECDVSDFFIEQRKSFANLIGKQLAADLLQEFVYNPNARDNKRSLNVRPEEIRYELDGDSQSNKKSGLKYELELAYKAAKVSLEGIDRVCLPCKKNKIKIMGI